MRDRAHDLSPAWEELLNWWASTNVEQFTSGGRRWRTPWEPLRPTTVREKNRGGFLSETLVRTTRMRSDMTRRPMGVEHITHDSVEAGTRAPYAKFHQLGAPGAHLPARPLVSTRRVMAEGAPGAYVLSWIVDGRPNGGGSVRLER